MAKFWKDGTSGNFLLLPSSTEFMTDPSDCCCGCVAAFSYEEQATCGEVDFTDESTPTPVAWDWDFGDGGTSTTQNPTHTYSGPGIYTVTLTVTLSDDTECSTMQNVSVYCPTTCCPDGFPGSISVTLDSFTTAPDPCGTPISLCSGGDIGGATFVLDFQDFSGAIARYGYPSPCTNAGRTIYYFGTLCGGTFHLRLDSTGGTPPRNISITPNPFCTSYYGVHEEWFFTGITDCLDFSVTTSAGGVSATAESQ